MSLVTSAPAVARFADLGLPAPIVRRLAASGIHEPFPIQAAVIPDVLDGRDVCGCAPTGSGKTLGFGLPIVANLRRATRKAPTALVLAPTRELAEQISRELGPYADAIGFGVGAVYGGVPYGFQRKLLDRGIELVVACPGRLEDLIEMGAVRLADVTTVVIDEADQMSDMGFLPAVRRIVEQTAAERQVLLFSATLDGPVAQLVDDFQRDPARHEVGERGPDITAARHVFWEVERAERARHTAAAITALGSAMVFTRTRHGADRLAQQLAKLGVTAEPIHGGLSQVKRQKALDAFKRGKVTSLVATDVAARGVHVDGVAGVIHYDMPADAATYVHRSGRTARAGATGAVVSFVDRQARKATRDLQRQVGIDQPVGPVDVTVLRSVPVPLSSAATDESLGVVKFFHASRGFGFITQPSGADLFVHRTNVVGDGFKTLAEGQRVTYGVRQGKRGLEAFDVRVV